MASKKPLTMEQKLQKLTETSKEGRKELFVDATANMAKFTKSKEHYAKAFRLLVDRNVCVSDFRNKYEINDAATHDFSLRDNLIWTCNEEKEVREYAFKTVDAAVRFWRENIGTPVQVKP